MALSPTRNSVIVHRDAGVWRATLGADANTGVSSTADDPFKALELTIGKAREQGWKFDRAEMTHEEARAAGLPETTTEGHQKPDQGAESGEPAETLESKLKGKGEKIHPGDEAHPRGHRAADDKGDHDKPHGHPRNK